MAKWRPGDRVFAYWEEDEFWYPATITSVDGEDIDIKYEDGNEETTSEDFLFAEELEAGDLVEVYNADDEEFYEAEVTEVNGDRLKVKYDDGSEEWTTLENLRLSSEADWEVGDRVFAFFEADGYWYPATITAIDDETISIRYDDGEEEDTADDYLDVLSVEPDDELEAVWSQDGEYYPVTIREVEEDRVRVEFDDGDTEWTSYSNLRFTDEE